MSNQVREMVKKCLDALVNMDAELAAEVCKMDDVVDTMDNEMYDIVLTQLQEASTTLDVDILVQLLSASRHLERIADHATNIAEDILYMIEGRIVRHVPPDASDE
jgi:phosphate transport system protein